MGSTTLDEPRAWSIRAGGPVPAATSTDRRYSVCRGRQLADARGLALVLDGGPTSRRNAGRV